ncbi:hypothetical protein KSP40_PGU017943 [Platanthera guangdongensis]|uniref:Zinc finger, RING/FYVE/PHD-type n=1 Tax=Platanthera guangdongensis TaxID=2320717 RepID=A0ABR2LMY5_9ASPA
MGSRAGKLCRLDWGGECMLVTGTAGENSGQSNRRNMDDVRCRNEWDEVSCPICLDHPHNAVLLFCSSHQKGCRSYICDTSYRHSNCLDQFKKSRADRVDSSSLSSSLVQDSSTREQNDQRIHQTLTSVSFLTNPSTTRNSNGNHENPNHAGSSYGVLSEISQIVDISDSSSLKCPLCRGTVLGSVIVKEARQYLDLKPRSCSRESCVFTGNYGELRRHARRVHPSTRPVDVDPSRRRAWRRLESQRERGDILSAVSSAMPGAVMLGDYVIESGDAWSRERDFGEGY